jgi:excisionase family DNA binding protein
VEIANWAAARDVQARLGFSGPYVNKLVRTGRLRAVRTRLGWLIDPQSVEAFAAARSAQRAKEAMPV